MPAASDPQPPAARALSGIGRSLRRAVGAGGRSTPARLRAAQAVTVLLALAFALAGAIGVGRRSSSLADARTAARQLIAVQDVRVAVVRADAIASSSYLVGGQEDPAQRTAYLAEVERASNGIVAVANRVGGADADRLAEAGRLLSTYVGLVEQARANNRQGFPVGAAYQRQANAVVTNDAVDDDGIDVPDVVASLRAVEDSQRQQVNEAIEAAHVAGVWLQLVGWVLLAVLVAGAVWLANRFRRWVNVPIVAGGALLALVLVIGGTMQSSAISDADEVIDGPLRVADQVAQARAAGFDARSQEALTLINRGSGQANEARWQLSAAVAGEAVAVCRCSAIASFDAYARGHGELRALDDGGDWDAAVRVSLGQDGSASPTFEQFAEATATVVATNSQRADAQLGQARSSLGSLRAVVFLCGIAVAVLAAAGYGQRIREYR